MEEKSKIIEDMVLQEAPAPVKKKKKGKVALIVVGIIVGLGLLLFGLCELVPGLGYYAGAKSEAAGEYERYLEFVEFDGPTAKYPKTITIKDHLNDNVYKLTSLHKDK